MRRGSAFPEIKAAALSLTKQALIQSKVVKIKGVCFDLREVVLHCII